MRGVLFKTTCTSFGQVAPRGERQVNLNQQSPPENHELVPKERVIRLPSPESGGQQRGGRRQRVPVRPTSTSGEADDTSDHRRADGGSGGGGGGNGSALVDAPPHADIVGQPGASGGGSGSGRGSGRSGPAPPHVTDTHYMDVWRRRCGTPDGQTTWRLICVIQLYRIS